MRPLEMIFGAAGWAAAVYFYRELAQAHTLVERAEKAIEKTAKEIKERCLMQLNKKIQAAIEQSCDYAIKRMIEEGAPAGIDAVRCDISYHTARGWQPTIEGEIVKLPDDGCGGLPEISRASHASS